MSKFNRRDFLRAGGAGAVFAGFASARSPMRIFASARSGQALVGTPKVFTIFLRGAHDGVHTVVPVSVRRWGCPSGAST